MTDVDFKHVLVYTTEIGGIMRVHWSNPAEYEAAKTTRSLNGNVIHPIGDGPVTYEQIRPVMIALCEVKELHDFILGGPR